MNSFNRDAIEKFTDQSAQNYADYAGVSLEEARQAMSTVDPANSYRHEIKDSWNGNAEGGGCLGTIMIAPLLLLLSLFGAI